MPAWARCGGCGDGRHLAVDAVIASAPLAARAERGHVPAAAPMNLRERDGTTCRPADPACVCREATYRWTKPLGVLPGSRLAACIGVWTVAALLRLLPTSPTASCAAAAWQVVAVRPSSKRAQASAKALVQIDSARAP